LRRPAITNHFPILNRDFIVFFEFPAKIWHILRTSVRRLFRPLDYPICKANM